MTLGCHFGPAILGQDVILSRGKKECYCMIVVIGGAMLQTQTFGWLQVHDG